ncbi:MAG: hypothetical protein LBO62_07740 [Endomicrobium sp.]|nr:hypothetical protein [Endomicrobium sp.]
MKENKVAGKKGGKTAKQARLVYEKNTGQKVITCENFLLSADRKKLKNK